MVYKDPLAKWDLLGQRVQRDPRVTPILQELTVDREFKELLDHKALPDRLASKAPLASQDYRDRQDLEESVAVKDCQDL